MPRRLNRFIPVFLTLLFPLLFLITWIILSGYIIQGYKDSVSTYWYPPNIEKIYQDFDNLPERLEGYRWPTDITNIATSTFGEFRTTHFHAGIDISTRGIIGAPVFAAKSGYVERIGASPFGYGKYIIMRHDDGFSTLYAHLDRFEEKLNQVLYEHQIANRNYTVFITLEPDKFKFNQGELIGYSGDTGSGPPHLHFEIRDRNNNPVQPKLADNININDTSPPTFRRISILPLDETGRIDNTFNPRVMGSRSSGPGSFSVFPQPSISGRIGFAVDVYDRNDDTWYRHGIYGMDFYFDDELLFSIRYDIINIRYSRQIRLHYNHYLANIGYTRFRNLYLEEGNALPLYNKFPHGSGVIDTRMYSDGLYNYHIVAYDYAGNQATLTGSVKISNEGDLKKNILSEVLDPEKQIIPMTESQISISTELYRNMLTLNINGADYLKENIALYVSNRGENHQVPLYQYGNNEYSGRFSLYPSNDPVWRLNFIQGDTVVTHYVIVYSIYPSDEGEILLDGGKVRLRFGHDSVYHPLYFTFENSGSLDFPVYTFFPRGIPLNRGISMTVNVPENLKPFSKSLLYEVEGRRKQVLSTDRSIDERNLKVHLLNFPAIITAETDTLPPQLENLILRGTRDFNLRFTLRDGESGIDHRSILLTLNGDPIIARYEPDKSIVTYNTKELISPGEYLLQISVSDRAGNTTRHETTFLVE